jgi:hypothetical protein
MGNGVEDDAVAEATRYYIGKGWKVLGVSKLGGKHGGYDLWITKESEERKVEVKGCSVKSGAALREYQIYIILRSIPPQAI